uniref:Germin E protein n=1 Tax=Solanum tuberosum TaxID=4113 RepID=M1BJT0_SOLTU
MQELSLLQMQYLAQIHHVGKTNAIAFAGLSSQNAGVITIPNAVFGSDPPINDNVLSKAFQVDKKVIDDLQEEFWWDNN